MYYETQAAGRAFGLFGVEAHVEVAETSSGFSVGFIYSRNLGVVCSNSQMGPDCWVGEMDSYGQNERDNLMGHPSQVVGLCSCSEAMRLLETDTSTSSSFGDSPERTPSAALLPPCCCQRRRWCESCGWWCSTS